MRTTITDNQLERGKKGYQLLTNFLANAPTYLLRSKKLPLPPLGKHVVYTLLALSHSLCCLFVSFSQVIIYCVLRYLSIICTCRSELSILLEFSSALLLFWPIWPRCQTRHGTGGHFSIPLNELFISQQVRRRCNWTHTSIIRIEYKTLQNVFFWAWKAK